MNQPELGKIESMPIRELFKNETSNFTPWLALPENMVPLSDAVGLDLTVLGREVRVGGFSADLLASAGGGS